MIKHIENNFKDVVLDSKTLVLVDFYATWCGPCQMLSPVLEEISAENSDFEIVKVDVDKNHELARNYKIMAVPTMMIFKNGEVVDKIEGLVSKEVIINKMKNYL